MLTAKIAGAVLAAAAIVFAPVPAFADPGPVVVHGDPRDGLITTSVESPGSLGRVTVHAAIRSNASAKSVTCIWTQHRGYLQSSLLLVGSRTSPGDWYDVTCSDGSNYLRLYVPPAANNPPPPIASAALLALRAANTMQLPAPDVRVNPTGQALVGLAEWFWVDSAQWRALGQRTQAGPVWAQVTATPVSTTWDPGDGSPAVTCSGPGTPYDTTRPASQQRSDCTYTYARSSAHQPQTGPDPNDRFFTVTVTTTWSVRWVGSGGLSGVLPVIQRSRSFPLAVAEREAVVTGGSG